MRNAKPRACSCTTTHDLPMVPIPGLPLTRAASGRADREVDSAAAASRSDTGTLARPWVMAGFRAWQPGMVSASERATHSGSFEGSLK